MNATEFNKKYEYYIQEGHYGLAIDDSKVIEYLDKEFEQVINADPNFTFSQIKLKFGNCTIYSNCTNAKVLVWSREIEHILKTGKHFDPKIREALEWWSLLAIDDIYEGKGWANFTMKYYPEKTSCYNLTEEEILNIYEKEA